MLFASFQAFPQLAGLFIAYSVGLAVYRLYWSPLSKFPGPKLAAATWWYQFYHDIVRNGQYIWVVQSMHDQYGPIVRINPCEIHIRESDFYETLYASGGPSRKRDKWAWDTVGAAGVADSALSTVNHDRHRMRRGAIAPFFSMQNVQKLQPIIQAKVGILRRRLVERWGNPEPINVSHAFSALTNDVIMEYCFARSYNRLEAPDFDPSYKNASRRGVRLARVAKHFRFLTAIAGVMALLPDRVVTRLGPSFDVVLSERRRLIAQIEALKEKSSTISHESSHRTIFRELLSGKLPVQEKAPQRLAAEAQVLVSAGSETTARALTYACYYLLSSPEVTSTLKTELDEAFLPTDVADEGPVSLEQTQRLPYLTAVIKESLRLSYGVLGRLQRILPYEELRFHEWVIPRGTPVSMTIYDLHHDEAVFPDSRRFQPERWLDTSNNPSLDRYMVSFGRGSRQCLGMNLAMAEMYIALATLFRSFGSGDVRRAHDVGQLELFQTDETDIRVVGEVVVPVVKQDSQGVRIVVRA